MNSTAVWALCSAVSIGALLTGFSAPSRAQPQTDCVVTLLGNEPVAAGDGFLAIQNNSDCLTTKEATPISLEESDVSQNMTVAQMPVPRPLNTGPTRSPAPTPSASSALDLSSAGQGLTLHFADVLLAGDAITVPDVLTNGRAAPLSDAANAVLTAAANAMVSIGGSFVVHGYASVDGNAELNDQLSWDRARIVGETLHANGVALDRIFVLGHGETSQFGQELADNRRVTVEVYAGQ